MNFWLHNLVFHKPFNKNQMNPLSLSLVEYEYLHIRLTGSRAVTNRHASEAQSPAPGTSLFEIEWDILEGRERSWDWVLGLSFFVFGCLFCISVVSSRLFVCTFWLYNLVFK
jgi:hypothetical protein